MFRAAIFLSFSVLIFLQSSSASTVKPEPRKSNLLLPPPNRVTVIEANDPDTLKLLNSLSSSFQEKLNLKEKPTIKEFKGGRRRRFYREAMLTIEGIAVSTKDTNYECEAVIIDPINSDYPPYIKSLNCV